MSPFLFFNNFNNKSLKSRENFLGACERLTKSITPWTPNTLPRLENVKSRTDRDSPPKGKSRKMGHCGKLSVTIALLSNRFYKILVGDRYEFCRLLKSNFLLKMFNGKHKVQLRYDVDIIRNFKIKITPLPIYYLTIRMIYQL